MAKVHLVDTVKSYQESYGDTHIDYSKLVPKEHEDMVWFLLPNQVQKELQSIENVTFETLENVTVGKQNEAFTTPFQPKDYNHRKFAFNFSKEYLDEHKITRCEESDTTGSEE